MTRQYKKQGYHLFKRIMDLRDEYIDSYKRESHPKYE
jgi:hypothetical protein